MAILVDECRWEWRGRRWCHVVSSDSFDELHTFAKQLGLRRLSFQGDHYDVDEVTRTLAVELGATAVNSREIVRALRSSGLRRGPALDRGGLEAVVGLPAPQLQTERLILRQWTPDDVTPSAEVDADPDVMAMLGGTRSPEQSRIDIDLEATRIARVGFGLWAVEERLSGQLVGRVGVRPTDQSLPFPVALELAWRLRTVSQGRGYATEAASAVMTYAFEELEAPEVIAFTAAINTRSRSVMERLGMDYDHHSDFDHPRLAVDDPLRRHVLYRSHPDTHPLKHRNS